jgi:hypothetical protein
MPYQITSSAVKIPHGVYIAYPFEGIFYFFSGTIGGISVVMGVTSM